MSHGKTRNGLIAACLLGIGTARAELPTMPEREWLGHFLGFQTKRYAFGITDKGKAMIWLLDKKGTPLAKRLNIPVDFVMEESFPNGKVTARTIRPESLESDHPASNEIRNAVIRGKVTGGGNFEIYLNEDRGALSLGGRVLDPESMKNPLRFSIRMRFPDAYPRTELEDRKKIRAFGNKLKDDRMYLTWTDKKRIRQSISDEIDARTAEVNGPGISLMQLEFGTYEGNKFEIAAAGSSSMSLSNNGNSALHSGFDLIWTSDVKQDASGEARLVIEVK
jgi:hypothetical protein